MNTAAAPNDKIRVMVVDDSAIIRGLVSQALETDPEIKIVATASNGKMALQTVAAQPVDIIILDIEMPEMDGITALPQLLKTSPKSRVIMSSSLTLANAEISLKALALGATDTIAKPSVQQDRTATERFYQELRLKVKSIARASRAKPAPIAVAPKMVATPAQPAYPLHPVKALAIASSTGGPQALIAVFKALNGALLHLPIFITQHMPANFTTILADHLSKACGRTCAEAKDGEPVMPGKIYLAPGDFHMVIARQGAQPVLRLTQDPPVNFCRPAADPMLASLAPIYGKHLLVAVLTGMGQDGLEGAKAARAAGATVIAQDEATSVVWGMPRAVTEAGLAGAVLPLEGVAPYLLRACK